MNATALVLAAHGSRHESAVNAQVRSWAAQVAQRTDFDEVAVAFHQGSPAFCEVLDTLSANEVTVIPVMTSAGYYSDNVLPRELARNQRFSHMAIRQTTPVGTHPAIPQTIADRVNELPSVADSSQLWKSDITIAIVGHGTPRHPASRNSTHALANQLRATHGFGEMIACFLDDEPRVEQLLSLTKSANIMVIPFLIGAGPHATSDLPKRIGMNVCDTSGPPFMENIAGQRVLCDVPFGSYPQMIDLIVDLAMRSGARSHPIRSPRTEVA